MDSHNALVNVQLFGGPIDPNHDPYVDPSKGATPNPLLFTLQETIFKFTSRNGGSCEYFTTYEGESMFKTETVASQTPA
jgi:hypothetical protein